MIGRCAAALLSMAVLAGCPPPRHTHAEFMVEILIQGETPLNPDAEGASRPLQVRLYCLRDDARFLAASPPDLALNDQALLGEDLLSSREITVSPGSPQPGPGRSSLGERPPEAKFVGILALYPGRRADGETWHAAVGIEDLDSIVFLLRRRSMKILAR